MRSEDTALVGDASTCRKPGGTTAPGVAALPRINTCVSGGLAFDSRTTNPQSAIPKDLSPPLGASCLESR